MPEIVGAILAEVEWEGRPGMAGAACRDKGMIDSAADQLP